MAAVVTAVLVDIGSGAAAPRVQTFLAVEDTFVNAAYPDYSFGRRSILKVDDTNPKVALLSFDTRAWARSDAAPILAVRTTATSAPGTVEVHLVGGTTWSENATTFRSTPPLRRLVGNAAVRPDRWNEISLDPAVLGSGVVSLALVRSGAGPDLEFRSRESADAPRLVMASGPAPGNGGTPSPSPSPTPAPGPGPGSGGQPPPRPPGAGAFLAYTPGSFFRTPLPDSAPLDAQSAQGISYVMSNDPSPHPIIRGVAGNEWGMPFAMSSCSDPVWTLTGNVLPEVAFLATDGFHAPADFADRITGTSDSPFVVIDRCGGTAMPSGFTVWGAKAVPGRGSTLQVGSAGAFEHDSNGLDRRNPLSDSDVNFRNRGAIPDAMVIRDDLLARAITTDGDLGHVLHMFWFETDSTAGAVHPMIGDESGKAGFGAEGMRIRIKPETDLASRGCTPAGLAVARTLQRYGAYLGDNAGASTSLKAEQGSDAITADALSCVTWDDFAFVRRGWPD